MNTFVRIWQYLNVLFLMGNISDKSCKENQNTRFMFSKPFLENRAACWIMWKNILQPDRPPITV
jgi:hypothetical protein